MKKENLVLIRHHINKTQEQMARLLGVSIKALQSFEQGWRKIPPHVQRQALYLLAKKDWSQHQHSRCWITLNCPTEIKENCPAWEFQVGHLCWFINGTICHGQTQKDWQKKIEFCRQCQVFRDMFPDSMRHCCD